MIGVILAAGRGSRLGDATESLPKPLMAVAGRTCLDFAIEALLAVASDVVVVTGYRAELIEQHIAREWPSAPVRTVRNVLLEAGNLTSLGAARPLMGQSCFVVTNADHLFPGTMYTRHFAPSETGIGIACERERPVLPDEMKVIEKDGLLVEISKTLPRYDGAYIGTTFVGQDRVQTYWDAFDRVHASQDIATASVEMVLHELARDCASAPQVCWLSGLKWFEVDTPEDLAVARESLTA
ncbi:NTP transferase domain-containing protein [Novosphingobium sp. ERN07]|uniref:phosphocholine cytidylyltransferase family protein n=1 Tax=Novosphingobium sp. ERN07 TaxID=2726187 RepID=UPI0014566EF4|nr:NTP transferase domain-containing protein [Novosphingobium sp. ERN07]NLR69647.1 NTP transferase domain-containing protein [Novosphingobium sp. ERN07]